ncbi:hypothetical protein VDBG_04174 [Verticillium alfalfae VaMs.102]|uniref:Uncharacterized protein n=1 Tax=Verticillium alfalfae (strain VaMs.102 / ATCC MYA-4576 / FGSC 10136) TaxID=526221 RepID=C9SG51_VERA1|nr:hypothetical protein VDBG_04174 [Verticillium alfalfae VaMs.102]EEY18065.1 hypothetical protein VDBG_04174 [Verticillium alfalfae VaMs.102]
MARARYSRILLRPATRSYATADKPPSAVANFYKTFTRPTLKVLLMATLTYQIAYLAWTKLEMDEIKAGANTRGPNPRAQVTS